jgi:hypothetical protein
MVAADHGKLQLNALLFCHNSFSHLRLYAFLRVPTEKEHGPRSMVCCSDLYLKCQRHAAAGAPPGPAPDVPSTAAHAVAAGLQLIDWLARL